jgi:hypothetical protein
MRLLRPSFAAAALAALFAVAACSDTNGLPPAHTVNAVDTVSLYALDGTPPSTPSAYSILGFPEPVRTDVSTAFDFVFNIDSAGHAVLLPTGAVGLGKQSGIRLESTTFDAITDAPTSGYADSTAEQVDLGTVAVIRSRPTQCPFGPVVYQYAKLQVLQMDSLARTISFQILVDQNCGYRGLQPGIPSR